jgi:hypothetical protein
MLETPHQLLDYETETGPTLSYIAIDGDRQTDPRPVPPEWQGEVPRDLYTLFHDMNPLLESSDNVAAGPRISTDQLGLLLPEDATRINEILDMYSMDPSSLLQEFTRASERPVRQPAHVLSISLSAADRAVVEAAVRRASEGLKGKDRRGKALALIARVYLGESRKEQ